MRRGRLFRKYVVVLLLLVGGVLLLSSAVDLYFSYQETKTALFRIQREQAVAAAARIEQLVHDIERQVRWTIQAAFDDPVAAREQREIDYLRLLRNVPAITELSHLDASGREQLRVSRLNLDTVGSEEDHSQAATFLEARAGKTYFSPVYFRNESEPYMTVALPAGEYGIEVTVADVNLKAIWDVVSRIRIGEAGYAYVVDSLGRLVAHPDISLVLQKRDLSDLPQVRSARSPRPARGGDSFGIIATGLQGGQVLTAYAPIALLEWLVLVEQPLAEAFAPLQASILRSVIVFALGLALSVLASVLLARRMVAPIRILQAGAARIGAGDLSHRLTVRTGDELETLADEVNRTAAQLQESYAGLEEKVEARTRELTSALEGVRALSQEIAEKSRQLEVASQHKSEFLASMSHELRTPLNAILGFNEMILGQVYGAVPPELKEPLTDIQNSGKHLLRLINNVLDLAKIEAGRMELALADYSVPDTVERVRTSLRALAADKGLELAVVVAEGLPLAHGDAGRITQCLMNLAGNALKFTREGRVEIAAELQGDLLVFRVSDTGIGIAEERLESVFAEFQQGDTTIASEFGGTGLGLSITRKFVEMHGGRIWAESELGKGSTFLFTIPLRLDRERTA